MNGMLFLVVALLAQQPDNAGLSVQLELASRKVRILDPVFARVFLTNDTKESEQIPLDMFRYATYTPDVARYPYGYGFPPAPERGASTSRLLRPIPPGGRLTVDYEILELPPADQLNHTFWNDIIQRHGILQTRLGSYWHKLDNFSHQGAGVYLNVRQRPDEEMDFLTELYGEFVKRRAAREHPEGWEELGSSPMDFGLTSLDYAYPDLVQKLVAYEEHLSPGSLRDIVHLVRLTQTLARSEDEAEQEHTVAELLQWLDTLPEIERHCLAMKILSWASMTAPGGPARYYELVFGTVQRLPEKLYEFEDYQVYRMDEEGLHGCRGYRAYRLDEYADGHPGFKDYLKQRKPSDKPKLSPPVKEVPPRAPGSGAKPSPDPFGPR